ncbi:MAG: type II secretion system F family protein [Bacillota bacterium]
MSCLIWFLAALHGLTIWFAALYLGERLGLLQPARLRESVGNRRRLARPALRTRWISSSAWEQSLLDLCRGLTLRVSSGLSLGEALIDAVRELRGPLKAMLSEAIEMYKVGIPMQDALMKVSSRCNRMDVRYLCAVLVAITECGGSVSKALEGLRSDLSDRIRARREGRAKSAEACLSAIILVAMPPVLLVFLIRFYPTLVRPLFVTPVGRLSLLYAAASWLIGVVLTVSTTVTTLEAGE